MSWWAALALLRCVSSSPAAASASLRTKLINLQSGSDPASASREDELADDLEAMATLLVEECLTAQVSGDGLEPLEGAAAGELLEAPASGNLDPGQRQQWLQEAVAEIDALQPALAALAERRADLAEEDHRRVREASLRSGESLRMGFRCEPSLPVDVIGLIVLLPAPVL